MDVRFHDISGGSQQFADAITNMHYGDVVHDVAPVVAEMRELRRRFDELTAAGAVSEPTRDAVAGTLGAVDDELAAAEPRRGRIGALLQAVGLLTAGLTAGAGFAEAVGTTVGVLTGTP